MNSPKDPFFAWFCKGAAMGAANVIPGVSGGTIAFVTGIYERLIEALKSFDFGALRLLIQGKWRHFAAHVDLWFLATLGAGVLASVFSLAKLLEFLFVRHPVVTWAFFFGLIVASIYFVGKRIERWNFLIGALLVVGVAIAVGLAVLQPAQENTGTLYLVLCGAVAISSMIIPGLSGSFVLVLMGNYLLVLSAITTLKIPILLPFAVGCALGLVVFSHILSWIFHHYRDAAIAMLTGFIAGSLLIIWPWKTERYLFDAQGELILRKGEPILSGYQWLAPPWAESTTYGALFFAALGFALVWFVEKKGMGLEGE